MVVFDLNRLNETLIMTNTIYQEIIDYKYFNLNTHNSVVNKQIKKELYLTYRGLLRVLFVSRSGKTDNFIKWATETLFTVHLGEQKEKEELSATLLGVDVKNIKSVFSTSAEKTPCVYLFMIGNGLSIYDWKRFIYL